MAMASPERTAALPSHPSAAGGRVTINEVARQARVSVMTVSNVLNGKPHVRPQTRQRVLDAVAQTGYRVNPLARALAGGRGRMLSVITNRFNLPYVSEVLQGAAQAAENLDYDLSVLMIGQRGSADLSVIGRLSAGALLIQPYADGRFGHADLPMHTVSVDGPGERPLSVDNYGGARQAMRHLLSLGHTRIGFISGLGSSLLSAAGARVSDAGRGDASERLRGYRAAMREAGLELPGGYLQEGDYLKESGYRAAQRLLSLDTPPTALFASSDAMAVGAVHAALDRGLSVPGGLSVVGFDDLPIAAQARPPLTTIRQPLQTLGATAVQMLIRLAEGENVPLPAPFSTELVVRESTAALSGSRP